MWLWMLCKGVEESSNKVSGKIHGERNKISEASGEGVMKKTTNENTSTALHHDVNSSKTE